MFSRLMEKMLQKISAHCVSSFDHFLVFSEMNTRTPIVLSLPFRGYQYRDEAFPAFIRGLNTFRYELILTSEI